MSKSELIDKTVTSLTILPEAQVREIADFADFLLTKISNKLLTDEVTLLNAHSQSFQFLEADTDIYTVNDCY